jgi:hypothetical protein
MVLFLTVRFVRLARVSERNILVIQVNDFSVVLLLDNWSGRSTGGRSRTAFWIRVRSLHCSAARACTTYLAQALELVLGDLQSPILLFIILRNRSLALLAAAAGSSRIDSASRGSGSVGGIVFVRLQGLF